MANKKDKEIRFFGREYTNRATGAKFTSYTSKGFDGQWYKVRFAKACGFAPNFTGPGVAKDCEYFIKRGGTYVCKDGTPIEENPTVWIMSCSSVGPINEESSDTLPF